jgi:hypothetical protein
MDDVLYFQKKLYQSLNVPVTRLESGQGFNIGRAAEISRDEVKFTKFVGRLRRRFSQVFLKALEKQLVLKGVISESDWPEMKNQINFDFTLDNNFEEFKQAEILQNRINTLNQITPYIGRYYSDLWVRKNVLNQSDEEIAKMMDEMSEEKIPMTAPPPEGMDKSPAPIANRPQVEGEENPPTSAETTDNGGMVSGTGAAY